MTVTVPGPTLGVVGGGQLGRMLAEAAAPLGVEVVVLDPTPDCPAAAVARDQVVADFDDAAGVRELANRTDALTFEIEVVDPDLVAEASAAAEIPVHPSPATLRTTRDKLAEKEALVDAGVPVPRFRRVDGPADLREAVDEFGRVMLKARTGGYDGRGNVPVGPDDDFAAACESVGPAVAEEFVDFDRELSVIGVCGRNDCRTFPAGENVHAEEILRETVVPARTTDAVRERAQSIARDVLDILDGRGVFGIELFEVREPRSSATSATESDGRRRRDGGEVLVNEIAPRPHNSGHWTIEGAYASQFEQHVRAVFGWPLGSTDARGPTATANVLGDVDDPRPARLGGLESVLASGGVSLHWYGKREVRPLRKMGHLTAVGGDDADHLLARLRDLRDGLRFESERTTADETELGDDPR